MLIGLFNDLCKLVYFGILSKSTSMAPQMMEMALEYWYKLVFFGQSGKEFLLHKYIFIKRVGKHQVPDRLIACLVLSVFMNLQL